jgi:hypothetical protein
MGLINTLTRIVPLVIGTMGAVEAMFKAIKGKGSEKKEAYIEGVMAALGITEVAMNKDLVNDAKFKELLGKVADDIIAVNNFIRDYKSPE